MKKAIVLFSLISLISCNCYLQDIGPQTIYLDENCYAPIPDFRDMVIVNDNCGIDTVIQTPVPGSHFGEGHPYTVIRIHVLDIYGNSSDTVAFDLLAVDTIPPTITVVEDLVSYTWQERFGLLDAFQNSLTPFIPDSTYKNETLVMWSSPDYRHMGTYWTQGHYYCPCDSADFNNIMYGHALDQ